MDEVITGLDAPNVMTPGAWAIVGVVSAAILGAFGYLLSRWLKSRIKWQPLPTYYLDAKFFAPKGYDVKFLVEALKRAETALLNHTKWDAGQLAKAFGKMRVYVQPTDDWVDERGRKVAGLDPAGPIIVVGVSLPALCHEMAHQAEELIDGVFDFAHANWAPSGIWNASIEYEAWLREQQALKGVTNDS